jgi:hypothetical protein
MLLFDDRLFSPVSPKESFADESSSRNLWYRTNVIAPIEYPTDLSWIFEIEKEARKLGYLGEVKSYFAYQIINHLDTQRRKNIWHSIQDVPVLIIDPKYYLKELGVKVINQYSYSFEIYGIKFQINRSDQMFKKYEEFLQELLSERILIDSPLPDIENAIINISECYDVFPGIYDFEPKKILKQLSFKTPKKQIINVVKLSSRLHVSFFELCDRDKINSLIKEQSYFEMHLLWPLSYFYRDLLIQSISKNRYFDEGNPKSIEFIKELSNKIKTGLRHNVFGNYLIIPDTKIEEIKSEEDIRMRASDVVSGIAKMIYGSEGLKGLKNRFSYIFFNGRKV